MSPMRAHRRRAALQRFTRSVMAAAYRIAEQARLARVRELDLREHIRLIESVPPGKVAEVKRIAYEVVDSILGRDRSRLERLDVGHLLGMYLINGPYLTEEAATLSDGTRVRRYTLHALVLRDAEPVRIPIRQEQQSLAQRLGLDQIAAQVDL